MILSAAKKAACNEGGTKTNKKRIYIYIYIYIYMKALDNKMTVTM